MRWLGFLILVTTEAVFASRYEWGYTQEHGGALPEKWASVSDKCGGSQQSPVNICTKNCPVEKIEEVNYGPIQFWGYDKTMNGKFKVSSTSYYLKVELDPRAEARKIVKGGGFENIYEPTTFHLHFGQDSTEGSEHAVNNEKLPLELHVIHTRADFHQDTHLAVNTFTGRQDNKLAIVGILFKEGKHNEFLETLIRAAEQGGGSPSDKSAVFINEFAISALMPADGPWNFARYRGSLTVPTCDEIALWTVMLTPLEVSPNQLNRLRRSVNYTTNGNTTAPVGRNWRPLQPLNGRKVAINKHSEGAVDQSDSGVYGPEASRAPSEASLPTVAADATADGGDMAAATTAGYVPPATTAGYAPPAAGTTPEEEPDDDTPVVDIIGGNDVPPASTYVPMVDQAKTTTGYVPPAGTTPTDNGESMVDIGGEGGQGPSYNTADGWWVMHPADGQGSTYTPADGWGMVSDARAHTAFSPALLLTSSLSLLIVLTRLK